jgi:hypothetical protein
LNEEPSSETPLLEKLAVPSSYARSGDTGIGARDKEMRESVLEAQRYPEITFDPQHFTLELRGEGQFQATMEGVLTLHGGRHDVALTAQGQLVEHNLTATAHFSVPFVDWGLKDPSVIFLTVAKQVDTSISPPRAMWSGQISRPEVSTSETSASFLCPDVVARI